MFAPPIWLRDLGIKAWLLVGVAGMLVGAVWLLSLTQTIVTPVITAAILASVLAPVVRRPGGRIHAAPPPGSCCRYRDRRVGVGMTVLSGISAQARDLAELKSGASKAEGWPKDPGVSTQTASDANADASGSVSSAFHFLVDGPGRASKELASPRCSSHLHRAQPVLPAQGRPADQALARAPPRRAAAGRLRAISGRTIRLLLRGYFAGVTAVAAFNGSVIGLGALILGVPLAGSIAVVNFVGAYIPYLGVDGGAFTVLIALGDGGRRRR